MSFQKLLKISVLFVLEKRDLDIRDVVSIVSLMISWYFRIVYFSYFSSVKVVILPTIMELGENQSMEKNSLMKTSP